RWEGLETTACLWKHSPELQVVICTACSDCSWEPMIRQLGTSDNLVILRKPFDKIDVLQLAHTLTRKWALAKRTKLLEQLDQIVLNRNQILQEANTALRKA